MRRGECVNIGTFKQLLEVCFVARRIVETLPELPAGMKPRHIHVLEMIQLTLLRQGVCRVSDVSAGLDTTMPSITKLIQELERLDMVEKQEDKTDKRVALLTLTDAGRECLKRYLLDFHGEWAEAMGEVSEEQVSETAALIERLRTTMPRGKEGNKRNGK